MIKRIKGVENIPNKAQFIIVSNHEELADPLYIVYLIIKTLNRKVHFIATPTWWFLGETICRQWAGCIPLFDSKQAFQEAKNLIKSGEIVGIFPEGHLDQDVRHPKTGTVRLAFDTKTSLLPVCIKSSSIPFRSTINIGKLIYIKNDKNIKKQTEELMRHIHGLRNNYC